LRPRRECAAVMSPLDVFSPIPGKDARGVPTSKDRRHRHVVAAAPRSAVHIAAAPSASAATHPACVVGHFKESPNQSGDNYALRPAVSSDGLGRMPLNHNNPVVTPAEGPTQEFRSSDWTFHGTDHGA
ncbi:hypothetical protein ACVCAG_45640, partial [Streptosporangium sp. G12]